MIHGVWEAFIARLGRRVDADEEDDSGFVPSPLDLSVRDAHGGQDITVERELSKICEQAARMEDADREN